MRLTRINSFRRRRFGADAKLTVLREGNSGYETRGTVSDNWHAGRTRDPEDASLVLWVKADEPGAESLTDRRATHVAISGAIYSIDYGDPLFANEPLLTIRVTATNERLPSA